MLMEPFGQAVGELAARVDKLDVVLPTLPRIEEMVRDLSKDWAVKPLIVLGDEEKWKAFSKADAALAASGTVSLELALSRIPSVLSYKADWFARKFLMPKITIWSAALPNIIADEPVVPEYFNEFVRPGMLARNLERLMRLDRHVRRSWTDLIKLRRSWRRSNPLARSGRASFWNWQAIPRADFDCR